MAEAEGNGEIPNDSDLNTQELLRLFRDCFIRDGVNMLPPGPTIVSLGSGMVGSYESAALRQIDPQTLFFALEPDKDKLEFDQNNQDSFGGSDAVRFLTLKASDFLRRLNGYTNSQLRGMPIDAFTLRNPFGKISLVQDLPGLLWSSKEVQQNLQRLILDYLNPGGSVVITYTWGSIAEEEAVNYFVAQLMQKGEFRILNQQLTRKMNRTESSLVYPDTGLVVLQREQ